MTKKSLRKKNDFYLILTIIFVWLLAGFSAVFSRDFKGAEYRTIEEFTYGRFETRMIPPDAEGVLSSMFTYHEISSLSDWNEIDIEIIGRYEKSVQFNVILQGRVNHVSASLVDFVTQNDFHDYAFEWTPDYVAWFIDNVEVYRQQGGHITNLNLSQKLMMNIWNPVHDNWVGSWNPKVLPVFSYYDWVSYASYTPGTGDTGTDKNFTLQWIDEFDSWDESRWQKATHTFEGNNCDFLPDNAVIQDGKLILCLTDDTNTGYVDKNPPIVLWARGYKNEVQIRFSERVNKESAEKLSNYTMPGIDILSAELLPGDRKVKLITSELNPANAYNIIVLGIRDVSADANMLIGGVQKVEMDMETEFPVKINFGNVDYPDYQMAQNWTPEASHGYMDGNNIIWPTATDIVNTDDDLLYQTERQGLIKYHTRLENGNYNVLFRFSENKHEAAGARVFDIYVEDKKVITNLDVFDRVGKNSALDIKIENIEVADRELNIHFRALTGEAFINALEIEQNPSGLQGNSHNSNREYWIAQNYPNPFNPVTAISYRLSAVSRVDLSIYNILGQRIVTLVSEQQTPGNYQVKWDAGDLPSGVYYYQLTAEEFRDVKKMMVLK